MYYVGVAVAPMRLRETIIWGRTERARDCVSRSLFLVSQKEIFAALY